MSDAVAALSGATFVGTVKIRDAGLRGMVSVRGDLESDNFRAAIQDCTGLDLPDCGGFTSNGPDRVIWMSPDELLIMTSYQAAPDLAQNIGASLKDDHHLVVNQSDSWAVFVLKGGNIRDVLARLSPADLSSDRFLPGQVRRTRLAQVAAAIWMLEAQTAEIICFRSVAEYVFGLLRNAAGSGSEI